MKHDANRPWLDGRPLLARSVNWRGSTAALLTLDGQGESHDIPLADERLTFRVRGAGPYCLGVMENSATGRRITPCPDAAIVTKGRQCERCAARDVSRFMHHSHRGGYVPPELEAYLNQSHWLYLATFADGTSKIGTASNSRKQARLDEQGAVRATYVAKTSDGLSVRHLEDSVTEHVGIPQTKHTSAKLASLLRPLPPERIDAAHASAVEEVRRHLAGGSANLPMEQWKPPETQRPLFERSGNEVYPHMLAGGEHCITVVGCVGQIALVTVNDDDARLVLDLGQLRGRIVEWCDAARSPMTASQEILF